MVFGGIPSQTIKWPPQESESQLDEGRRLAVTTMMIFAKTLMHSGVCDTHCILMIEKEGDNIDNEEDDAN